MSPTCDRAARLRRLAGAGISLGTGSVHGVTASIGPAEPIGFGVGYHSGAEFALWLIAIIAAAATSSQRPTLEIRARVNGCPRPAHSAQRSQRWQMLGLLGGGWQLGIDWRASPLLLAGLACVAACPSGFGLFQTLRFKGPVALGRGRALAALVMGARLVVVAADLPLQTASAHAGEMPAWGLTALALLGSAGVLLASRGLLLRLLSAERDGIDDRRACGARSLNDPLTGLPTRELFEGTLAQAVSQADAGKQWLALLFINLDAFKAINQSFGNLGGDQVLREAAARIRALAKPHMVARLAGNEFLALPTGDPQTHDVSALAAQPIASICAPFMVERREATMSCSVGIAM